MGGERPTHRPAFAQKLLQQRPSKTRGASEPWPLSAKSNHQTDLGSETYSIAPRVGQVSDGGINTSLNLTHGFQYFYHIYEVPVFLLLKFQQLPPKRFQYFYIPRKQVSIFPLLIKQMAMFPPKHIPTPIIFHPNRFQNFH